MKIRVTKYFKWREWFLRFFGLPSSRPRRALPRKATTSCVNYIVHFNGFNK